MRARGNLAMKTIYRAEAIGSLLRPAYLRDARRSLRSKEITTAQFKKIEDRAVDEINDTRFDRR
jgi:methionine synthase II (cobalamin-independent)